MDVTRMSIPDWGLLVVLLLAGFSLFMTAATHLAVQRVNARAAKRQSGPTPPISVLKPLCGVDEGLYENLAALARQEYPEFELVLGAEDPDDPALNVARAIRRDFPELKIRIVAGAPRLGRPAGGADHSASHSCQHGHHEPVCTGVACCQVSGSSRSSPSRCVATR